jgi:ribosomal protein S18 acetylase RimI-like enzyme
MAKTTRRAKPGVGLRARRHGASAVPLAVRIRSVAPQDADVLGRLQRQADEVHARLLPDFFQLPPAEWAKAPALGPGSTVLVADGPTGIVGYVAVQVVDTPTNATMTPCRRAYVDTIVVDEADRGRGIGTALMRAAADWARQHQVVEMVLTVWSTNRAAEALYRHLGYGPIARVLRRAL